MSSIRPLATIAVLAALGVYLAHQINQGPPIAMNQEWSEPDGSQGEEAPGWDAAASTPTAIEVPPLGGPRGEGSLEARSAPDWAEAPPSAPSAPAAPVFPTLPDTAPAATASNERLPLPASIPQANYGDAPATEPAISGAVPSLGTSVGVAAEPPSPPGFDVAWDAVQTALNRDELTRAHQMLSRWRDEPALAPAKQIEVQRLLAQLAGSVVYSTDHRLEPPHVVAPGETLVTIAGQYNIPWQLLAKINGVAEADGLTPGQSLKVIRGPFAAEVDLDRGELVLLLGENYAGRFPLRVEGSAPGEGDWRVGQKLLTSQPAAIDGMEPKVFLENGSGQKVELSASVAPPAAATGRLSVASNDLADLYDILSVGSRVTVRR